MSQQLHTVSHTLFKLHSQLSHRLHGRLGTDNEALLTFSCHHGQGPSKFLPGCHEDSDEVCYTYITVYPAAETATTAGLLPGSPTVTVTRPYTGMDTLTDPTPV